jgi:hypothetical protein
MPAWKTGIQKGMEAGVFLPPLALVAGLARRGPAVRRVWHVIHPVPPIPDARSPILDHRSQPCTCLGGGCSTAGPLYVQTANEQLESRSPPFAQRDL